MEFDPEAVFGGIVLVFLLTLIFSGKIRLEWELERQEKDSEKLLLIKDETIQEQQKTIETLTTRDEVTHHLLQELRDLAIKRSGADSP